MTVETLKDCNKKALAQMAKDQGIVGWHAMRKDQLIRALAPGSSSAAINKKDPVKTAALTTSRTSPSAPTSNGQSHGRRSVVPLPARSLAPMPPRPLGHACFKDRIITMVRDPFWLHTYWELSRATLARAQAALGQDWHTARPILRLMEVSCDETASSSERPLRDIVIHGGVNNWYIDVTTPPRCFRVDIGYLTTRGKFFVLARSNLVSTPKAGASESIDQNWASVQEQFEKIYAQSGGSVSRDVRELFEERLGRPMHGLAIQSLGTGALPFISRGFHFHIDAELIVYGSTEPNARVTLQGEPVPLRPDGTFTMRYSMPDSRQIIPATAASPDGAEERTIVLAVERNTKELEPMIHDGNEL